MQAIEFETRVRDRFLEIPAEYENISHRDVKVIILIKDEHRATKTTDAPRFMAASFPTKNFRFDRDEANER